MAAIELRNIVKVFSDKRRGRDLLTLDNINLDIEANDFVCLLGPSGCGKSTLLNIIAGFEQATSGRTLVDGKQVERPGSDRGVVFQQPTLMPWLTAIDNVAFHLKLKGVGKAERHDRAMEFIDLVGLRGFEHHHPSETVRRHEPAGRHRPRAADEPERHPDGRAVRGAGRPDQARNAGGAGRDLAEAPLHHRVRHPQRRRGRWCSATRSW